MSCSNATDWILPDKYYQQTGQENVMALLVDGRSIASQQGLDTPLKEGGQVYFVVMVAGG